MENVIYQLPYINKMTLKEAVTKSCIKEDIKVFDVLYFAKICRKFLYFGYFYDDITKYDSLELEVRHLLEKILIPTDVERFFASLVTIRETLEKDITAIMNGDPAVLSKQEAVLCYPGLEAITYYRIAHEIYQMGYKLTARLISEYAHRKTQVDIHPAATIGNYFCIDHGTGVVIGGTAVIGDNVRIYQGVTLGAKWLNDVSQVKNIKRHPTIGDNVIIYANATILGGNTYIKAGSIIGANAFITNSN